MRLGSHITLAGKRLPVWPAAVLLLGLLLVLIPFGDAEADFDLPDRVDFNQHIRPILSNNCYVCHGPDHSTREADLRLDTREHATARRETGRAIVPGSARRSLLIQRVTAEDPDERMPKSAGKTLTPHEIALLERWIEQGAEYKPHWSLIPPERAASRDLPDEASGAAVIDHFVRERLTEAGLAPAPPASRPALLRRLSYVLTGLPPSPDAVQAFVDDTAPDAYEKQVDRLLASPHFGERWARHWMDLVRYAESKGHEFDFTIEGAWHYRDYLIRAFNADVPYDQFVTEHLAGDMLQEPRIHPEGGYNESMLATAFLALGEGKHSPVDVREDEADRINNIIDVTTKTFQGLTVGCARCHDHKFDPIPTADYYALYGIFESTRFASTPLYTTLQQARLDSIKALQAALRGQLAARWLGEAQGTPVQTVADTPRPSRAPLSRGDFLMPGTTEKIPLLRGVPSAARRGVLNPASEEAAPDSTTAVPRILGDFRAGRFDGWFAHGPAFGSRPAMGLPVFDAGQQRIDSLAVGLASSRRWGTGLPGALRSPTFTIEHDSLDVVAAGHKSVIRIIIDNFQLIRFPIHGGLDQEVDSPNLKTYRFDLTLWQGRKAYVELLVGTYDKRQHITDNHLLVRSDSSYIEAAYAVAYSGTPPAMPPPAATEPDLEEALRAWAAGQADAAQAALLDARLRRGDLDAALDAVAPHLAQIEALRSRFGAVEYFMGVTEGDAVETPVFERGNFKMPAETPEPHRFFTALDPEGTPFTETASGRMELARAITDPANPLTARVMVNRLWHHVFGRGLVETVDDFGAQGKPPTHPALLDALALRFTESGWSMKAMLRAMVLSETFRQATQADLRAAEVDPNNLLWHHYPVRRLEAEAIRDGILAVSGRLDSTLYGLPVPVHLTEFMKGRGRPIASGPLDGDGRRSLYIAVRRNFLWPMMLAFDMPIPFSTFGRRNTSNVPAQSLTLLNDPFVAEQAAVWAEHLVTLRHLDTEARIAHMYQTALSRLPTADETAAALAFLREQARSLGLADDALRDDPRPWAAYGHVVFNLKEFIYLV